MREGIGLYRGKRKDNGEWVEGYFCIKYFQDLPHGRFVIQYKPKNDSEMWQPEYMAAEVIPETVGQYIGKTDKNGKRIFEGDIVKYTSNVTYLGKFLVCIGQVEYNKTTASYAVDARDNIGAKNYDYFPIKCEVIGNIHDNPELLQNT